MDLHKKEHDLGRMANLGDFILDEYEEEKTGIAYEKYYVVCVLLGHFETMRAMMEDPAKYQESKESLSRVDSYLGKILAMLHDIGLTVCLEGHNDIGFGVIKGGLTVRDILDTPVFSERLKEGCLTLQEKEHVRMAAEGRMKCSDLTEEERIGFSVVLARCMRFYIGYGVSGIDYDTMDALDSDRARKVFENIFPQIDDEDILRDAVDSLFKDGRLTITDNRSDLQYITAEVRDILTEDEVDVLAEAVQDHIYTVDESGRPYQYRNIYGKLLANTLADEKDKVMSAAKALNISTLDRDGHFS